MSIDVAVSGQLTRDPESKTSASGRAYLRFNIRIGNGDAAQFANVMAFNDVDELADRLSKDSRVYIEGTLTADAWVDKEGKARPSLTIMTWRCVETHRIGRNKPKRETSEKASVAAGKTYHSPRSAPAGRLPSSDFSDDIPFAPEVR